MNAKQSLFILMLLSLSAVSFAQHSDHEQAGAHTADGSADQHGGMPMKMNSEKGHGGMSMKMDDENGHGSMSVKMDDESPCTTPFW